MNWICRCAAVSTLICIAGSLLLAPLAGCSGDSTAADRPKTVPVQGTVTHKGQPLADASVAFVRSDNTRGAVGRTDSGGRYSLMTFEPGDGAPPGEYGVQIVKYEESGVEPEDGETPPLKSLIPEKYAAVGSSGLKATVTEEGDNTFDFDLQ